MSARTAVSSPSVGGPDVAASLDCSLPTVGSVPGAGISDATRNTRSPQLERIIAEGTVRVSGSRAGLPSNQVRCKDGFEMSVIAGGFVYSTPRDSDAGPFTAVEVGFPSARPEPWDEWEQYCESPETPTDTVYGFVPVDLVRALVESHGGTL